MESTFDSDSNSGGTGYGNGKAQQAGREAADAARKARDAGGQAINGLMADVQDLLNRLAHVADPEIARLRSKVESGLSSVKKSVADGADQVQRQVRGAMDAGDGYVRDRPWQAVGVAALAGLAVGFLIARR